MKLLVYARHELINRPTRRPPEAGASPADADTADAALLLEGSWGSDPPCRVHGSLDEAIDGRFDWIDRQAADWAELLGGSGPQPGRPSGETSQTTCRWDALPPDGISPAYLNVLALRYYLVKLIRALAYLTEVQPLRPGDLLELVAAAGRDQDYAEVLSQHCRTAGVHYRVRWVESGAERAARFPPNARWRRCLGGLASLLGPLAGPRGSCRRVVLCGDPRLLDPVCRELLARRCGLWWLYDRFALRSWLRWRTAGVGQLVCNSSLGRENRLNLRLPERLDCRGVNLAGPIRRWLAERVATHGPRQTRLIEQIDAHLRRLRPDALVLDEDATPLARAAVAVGRRYGAASLVVQHGVPCCRFGFAPAAADRILVWGRSSAEQLIDWGVPAERIRLTGPPQHARPPRGHVGPTKTRPARILLLSTVPPRDDRPDAVALHLTGLTYAEMLRMAFAAAAAAGAAELIVKLHPRSGDDPAARAVLAEFPALRSRLVRCGRLGRWLAGVDCVLSCGSSAGVEATLAGLPVIQLAPPGASGFPPHDRWGLAGTARSQAELRELLAQVTAEGRRPARGPDPNVFASYGRRAAARIADEVLAPIDPVRHDPHVESLPEAQQLARV